MSNLGRPFLIPVTDYVDSNQTRESKDIINDVNTCSVVNPRLDFRVTIDSPLKEVLEDKLPKETVYKLRRDIFAGLV